jgi:hypothetical protein
MAAGTTFCLVSSIRIEKTIVDRRNQTKCGTCDLLLDFAGQLYFFHRLTSGNLF